MNLINSHHGKVYKAFDPADPENTLLWASRWSYQKLMEKKADMQMAGKSSNEFAREYLNDPISEEERVFKKEWLYTEKDLGNGCIYKVPKNYITKTDFELLRKTTFFNGFAQIDLADTTGDKSDYTGITVELVNPAGYRFIVQAERRRIGITGIVDLVYEIWDKWRPYGLMTIGIEKKGFEDQVKPLFDEERNSGRRKSYPLVTELKPMGRNKENRISGALQGLFENGKIVFVVDEKFGQPAPTSGMIDLLEELYNFPSSKNDDLSDSLAYSADIIQIPQEEDNKKRVNKEPNDDPYKEEMVYEDNNYNDDPY